MACPVLDEGKGRKVSMCIVCVCVSVCFKCAYVEAYYVKEDGAGDFKVLL